MKYWRNWLLIYCLFFCISCRQNSKTADKTAPADQNLPHGKTSGNYTSTASGKEAIKSIIPENIVGNDSLNFDQVFNLFLQTILQQDSTAFNQYIHPAYKLYIIEQPGALPQFTKVSFIQNFKRAYQNQSFFSIRNGLKKCNLNTETLPTFNCDGQGNNPAGFSKQGCFVADASVFQKNEAHKYAGLSAAEMQQIENLQPLLNKTVVHTSSAFRFHFGNLEGKWYVFFIELIVPCSA